MHRNNNEKELHSAAEDCNCLKVLALLNNNYNQAADLLFEDLSSAINNEAMIKNRLFTMLRFTPINVVDKLIESYSSTNLQLRQKLKELYAASKEEFCRLAPYFSRYSDSNDLESINKLYFRDATKINYLEIARNDLAYGERRQQLLLALLDKLKDSDKNPSPTRDEFLSKLPASQTGSRRVAALLELIAAWLSEDTKNNYSKYSFNNLRGEGRDYTYVTYASGRYRFGLELIKAVENHSNEDIDKNNGYPLCKSYFLYFQKQPLTYVQHSVVADEKKNFFQGASGWNHGIGNFDITWGRIEDLFEEICQMNVGINDKNSLTEFYKKAAEMVWLIGNTQPLQRGSGSVAELMLILIHKIHNLKPPILRLEFPQLDVLDISFPLADYIKLFPKFFEPSTVPMHLAVTPEEQIGSVSDQLSKMYKGINQNQQVLSKTHHTLFYPNTNKNELLPEPPKTPTKS